MIDSTPFMAGMSASHLRFTVQAREAILLEGQPGSALRGALYHALTESFCTGPDHLDHEAHAAHCPVCWLMALEDSKHERGQNIPRPITIQPPEARAYYPGEVFSFGVTLIGTAQILFPYVARSVVRMGSLGIGRGRGRFKLGTIYEVNPLFDATRRLVDVNTVRQPNLQITPGRILEAVPQQVTSVLVDLYTPMRLISRKKLVKTPDPAVFMARLVERCQSLVTYYGESPTSVSDWSSLHQELTASASKWRTAYNDTRWFEAFSGSKRKSRNTPISGLVGRFRWEGDITLAYSWLLWGQSLHIGKDTVKGNGWYQIIY